MAPATMSNIWKLRRCALLDRIDYNYAQMKASGYAWPVIDMHIRYANRRSSAVD